MDAKRVFGNLEIEIDVDTGVATFTMCDGGDVVGQSFNTDDIKEIVAYLDEFVRRSIETM